jgi:D-alanyl-D-alanine carboxypeptidase/Putative peptidoglycan binding domain
MKVIKIGDQNNDVKKWQYFLIGQDLYHGVVTGIFDAATQTASIAFQKKYHLQPDGIIGNKSVGAAMLLGFGVLLDERNDITGENFPSKPTFEPLVTHAEREKLFGKIAFKPNPTEDSAENITITNHWDRDHLITVLVPQLVPIKGSAKVYFHKKGAAQLQKLWSDWEQAGLLHYVLSWGGAYNPRFVRGSKKQLSNHAFGTAFDINDAWNKLGTTPALVGQKGSVRELVTIAHKNGFYWGGHFTRRDGMHFEIAKIL